jgi:hypothetical protein
VSLVYVSLFAALGLLMSTLVRRSSVSFLLSLVLWIGLVLIIPRTGIMAAGHLAPVPALAQVEGMRDAYATQHWEEYYAAAEKRFQAERRADDDAAVDESELWANMVREDSLRTEVRRDIEAHETRLREDLENKRKTQQRLGFVLARISPAAVYQLAAMSLAGTDLSLKSRYEEAMIDYRDRFLDYVNRKTEEAGPGAGAVMIQVDSEKGLTISSGRSNDGIDASDRPRFTPPQYSLSAAAPGLIIDTGLLILFTLAAFGAAFVCFLRFDVR